MFNLLTYFNKLTNNVQRNDVDKNITKIIDIVADNRNIVNNATDFLSNVKLLDSAIVALEKDFIADIKIAGLRFKGGLVEAIKINHSIVYEQAPLLRNLVRKNLSNDNYKSALTYENANIIRLVELFDFSVDYSLKLLHWILNSQSASLQKSGSMTLTKGELSKLKDNFDSWTQVFKMLLKIKDLNATVQRIPSITIANDWAGEASGSNEAKDPLQMGLVPVRFNPVYYALRYFAEWEVERNRANIDRKKVLELRLYYLKSQMSENPDTSTQNTIQKMEAELSSLEYQIKRFEESLND